MSRYCSEYCGIEMAAARLALCGIEPEFFWSSVRGARRLTSRMVRVDDPASVAIEQEYARGPKRTRFDPETAQLQERQDLIEIARLRERLSTFASQRRVLVDSLASVETRLQYLRFAVRRWETMCKTAAEAEDVDGENEAEAEIRRRRHQRKYGSGPMFAASAQCGFDVKLVFESEQWKAWTASDDGRRTLDRAARAAEAERDSPEELDLLDLSAEGLSGVCLRLRKQCDRHMTWPKVRQTDFELERTLIVSRGNRQAQSVDELTPCGSSPNASTAFHYWRNTRKPNLISTSKKSSLSSGSGTDLRRDSRSMSTSL